MSILMKHGETVRTEKKKVKIIQVSKNEQREIWTFEKSQSFLPSLLQFLLDLGFSIKDQDIEFFFAVPHGDGSYTPDSYIHDPYSQKYLLISLFNDEMFTFYKRNLDLEVIFFNKEIIMTIRSNKKSSEIGKLISKFADF
jgi:hypothetical protein